MGKGKTAAFILLLLLGFGILAYPLISDGINRLHGSYAIDQMQLELENKDLAQQRLLAEEYNSLLHQSQITDVFSQENAVPEEYELALNLSDGMMGYIRIPKIDVNLPIYHGTGEEVLAKGIGHLPQSALPIGGKGNHSVLTGHTGLPSAKLFTDLTQMEIGDSFSIHVLGEELTYCVDQIKVVLPSEGQDLTAAAGEDYCTLVTCTPYGINSHRLLVRGTRVETPVPVPEQLLQQTQMNIFSFLWIPTLAAAAILFAILLRQLRRRK